jgi:hypothetical protein
MELAARWSMRSGGDSEFRNLWVSPHRLEATLRDDEGVYLQKPEGGGAIRRNHGINSGNEHLECWADGACLHNIGLLK